MTGTSGKIVCINRMDCVRVSRRGDMTRMPRLASRLLVATTTSDLWDQELIFIKNTHTHTYTTTPCPLDNVQMYAHASSFQLHPKAGRTSGESTVTSKWRTLLAACPAQRVNAAQKSTQAFGTQINPRMSHQIDSASTQVCVQEQLIAT